MGAKNARKLLQKAKDAPAGWSADEVIRLYEAFGFHIVKDGKHDKAKHNKLPPGIKATITRSSGEIHADYVRTAVKLIMMVTDDKGEKHGRKTPQEG